MGSVTLLILVGSSVGHPGCHLHDRSSRRGSGGYETGGGRHGHGSSETDGEGTWTLQEGSLGVLYVEGVEKGCGGHETGRGRSIGRPVRERVWRGSEAAMCANGGSGSCDPGVHCAKGWVRV